MLNHFRHYCPEIIWTIEIHGGPVGYVRFMSVSRNLVPMFNRRNYAEILCVTVNLHMLYHRVLMVIK